MQDHWGKENVDENCLKQMGISKDKINNKQGKWTDELNRLSEADAKIIAVIIEGTNGERNNKLEEEVDQEAGRAVGNILDEIAPTKCGRMGGKFEDNMRSMFVRVFEGPVLHTFYKRLIMANRTGLITDDQKETIQQSVSDGTIMTNSMYVWGLPLKPPSGSGLKGTLGPTVFYWAVRTKTDAGAA